MSDMELKKHFIELIKKGEILWIQYNSLKRQSVSENSQLARAEILKLERLKEEINDNLNELNFTFYKMEAEKLNN